MDDQGAVLFLRIGDVNTQAEACQRTVVANLTTALPVERRLVKQDGNFIASLGFSQLVTAPEDGLNLSTVEYI